MAPTSEDINIPENPTQTCDRRFIFVPLCRQETEYTCGIACVQSLLGYYGFDFRQDELALILEPKPKLGTNYLKILKFMRMLGFQASFATNMTIDNLKPFINDGVTPILQLQAWGFSGVDYAADSKDSHYVIACGYDRNRIYFMDPWTLGNYTYLPVEELPNRWHVPDVHLGQRNGGGLIIKKENPAFIYNPRVVKYLG